MKKLTNREKKSRIVDAVCRAERDVYTVLGLSIPAESPNMLFVTDIQNMSAALYIACHTVQNTRIEDTYVLSLDLLEMDPSPALLTNTACMRLASWEAAHQRNLSLTGLDDACAAFLEERRKRYGKRTAEMYRGIMLASYYSLSYSAQIIIDGQNSVWDMEGNDFTKCGRSFLNLLLKKKGGGATLVELMEKLDPDVTASQVMGYAAALRITKLPDPIQFLRDQIIDSGILSGARVMDPAVRYTLIHRAIDNYR